MQYRTDRAGNRLSILGFGCMRFDRARGGIDLDKAQAELLTAIDGGVNYLDTAYLYPGSEAAVGEILARTGRRDQVYLATKLPHYLIKSVAGAERMFQEQLRRLRTDHIDYYLMHILTDADTWARLVGLGIADWIAEKKASGQIGQIGFSYHGGSEQFCRLVDAYDWDFCQIQYNYLDEHSQAGRRGLLHAHEKGLPVIIMEPLRGGRLVELPPQARHILDEAGGGSPARWGLRWLWDQPEVTVVLSGMHSPQMVADNLAAAADSVPGMLSERERAVYPQVVEALRQSTKAGCTGCGYCQPCPAGVDIPGVFQCWNSLYAESKRAARHDYVKCTLLRPRPSGAAQCVGCGQCERHCPQSLPIRTLLAAARRDLEGAEYRVMRCAVRRLHLWG